MKFILWVSMHTMLVNSKSNIEMRVLYSLIVVQSKPTTESVDEDL